MKEVYILNQEVNIIAKILLCGTVKFDSNQNYIVY